MTIISTIARPALLLIGAGLAIAGPSAGAFARKPVATSAAATPAPTDESATKRYCVVSPATTGTMLRSKTCKTRSDWLKTGFDPLDPK